MIIKFILIQILLICNSFESPIEEQTPVSAQSEENSSNFRYKTDPRTEPKTQNDIQNAAQNIRQKRAVSVNISAEEVTATTAFQVVRQTDADQLFPKPKRNGSKSIKSYDKLKSAISEFPPDFMSDKFRNHGGFVVHIFIFAYFCLGLALVCDLYFLESLQFISDALHLPPDIAGATFMAIGTSAPELFTSVIGVFISENDIGAGTIVGSAVFNLLVIPGVCGFTAFYNLKKMPKISSFPIIRDTIFYILTVLTLILCIKDNKVDWVESVILLSMYGLYVAIMFLNAQFAHLVNECDEIDEEETPLLKGHMKCSIEEDYDNNHLEDYSKIQLTKTDDGKYKEVRSGSGGSGGSAGSAGSSNTRSNPERQLYPKLFTEEERPKPKVREMDVDWMDNWVVKTIMFPFTILFMVTLPKPTKGCYVVTFIMSVVWIALLTYVVVWMTTIVGYSIGIPDSLSGITILAAGTSVPELISSYLVVKKSGLANMAICNSIGSNIFDILFCLGVPWFLKSLVLMITHGVSFSKLANTEISIQSAALPLTSLTLLIACFAMIIAFKITNWRLNFTVGIICTVVYIAFVIVSAALELNI